MLFTIVDIVLIIDSSFKNKEKLCYMRCRNYGLLTALSPLKLLNTK